MKLKRAKRRPSSEPQVILDLHDGNDEWLDTEHAAKILLKQESTLRKWRCIGKGPQFRGREHDVTYRKSDCLAYKQFGVRSVDDLNK